MWFIFKIPGALHYCAAYLQKSDFKTTQEFYDHLKTVRYLIRLAAESLVSSLSFIIFSLSVVFY